MIESYETAEDILGLLRRTVQARLTAANYLAEMPTSFLPHLLPLAAQDEAREMLRALSALDEALKFLARAPEPLRDDLRN